MSVIVAMITYKFRYMVCIYRYTNISLISVTSSVVTLHLILWAGFPIVNIDHSSFTHKIHTIAVTTVSIIRQPYCIVFYSYYQYRFYDTIFQGEL